MPCACRSPAVALLCHTRNRRRMGLDNHKDAIERRSFSALTLAHLGWIDWPLPIRLPRAARETTLARSERRPLFGLCFGRASEIHYHSRPGFARFAKALWN